MMNGARAWTTPSEPCSPRWPPWSSPLWAAERSTARSGAAGGAASRARRWAGGGAEGEVGCGGRVPQLGQLVVGEGVGVVAPVREADGELGCEPGEAARVLGS